MKKDYFIFVISFLILIPVISADLISLNSGGDEGIIITPGGFIERFFFCTPYTCEELGYTCGSWTDGCGGIINCGSCPSGYVCSNGTCVVSPEEEVEEEVEEEIVIPPPLNISVTPTEISLTDMIVKEAEEVIIKVTNYESTTQNLSVSQVSLDDVVVLNVNSITLAPGETKEIKVVFVSLKSGSFVGKILIGTKEILVSLIVRERRLLFDSNIVILNRNYKVERGDKLMTEVTLIPFGDTTRLDVLLKYTIKDYSGKVYLRHSESILVEKKINFRRNFDTGGLPLGDYVISLELVYPGGVAPSSSNFEVVGSTPEKFMGRVILYLTAMIFFVAIVIIGLLIKRKIRP